MKEKFEEKFSQYSEKQLSEHKRLVDLYSLQEDPEHFIIPAGNKRIFLLKRDFIELEYEKGHVRHIPIEEAIVATIKCPDLALSEALDKLTETK